MFYELSIAFLSIAISFVLYFSFFKYFQNPRRADDDITDDDITDDDIAFDPRDDLDGKELVLVSVVSKIDWLIAHFL